MRLLSKMVKPHFLICWPFVVPQKKEFIFFVFISGIAIKSDCVQNVRYRNNKLGSKMCFVQSAIKIVVKL